VLVPGVSGVAALLAWLAEERSRNRESGIGNQELVAGDR
jgi:hypothetical protein